MGAEVVSLSGEQFSAFGVKREDGGVHLLAVPSGSVAAREGLREDDLIQRVNGCPVRSVKDLRQCVSKASGKIMRVRVVRKFKSAVIDVGLLSENAN